MFCCREVGVQQEMRNSTLISQHLSSFVVHLLCRGWKRLFLLPKNRMVSSLTDHASSCLFSWAIQTLLYSIRPENKNITTGSGLLSRIKQKTLEAHTTFNCELACLTVYTKDGSSSTCLLLLGQNAHLKRKSTYLEVCWARFFLHLRGLKDLWGMLLNWKQCRNKSL